MSENLPHRTPATAAMQAADWEGELPSRLRKAFPSLTLASKTYLGQNFIELQPHAVGAFVQYLRDDEAFDTLTDLTAVDWPDHPERFEIIYILYSFGRNERVRVKTRVALDHEIGSVVSIFPAANWLEREAFDMFGIRFAGHPDLKRILMPEDWNGFPLRKESSIVGMDNDWVQRNLGIGSGQ